MSRIVPEKESHPLQARVCAQIAVKEHVLRANDADGVADDIALAILAGGLFVPTKRPRRQQWGSA